MKRTPLIAGLVVIVLSTLSLGFYESEAQKLLAFTGGVHAKAVWVRSSECQPSDYTTNSKLVAMDTRQGKAFLLDSVVGVHIWPVITRDGQYVIWNWGFSEFDPSNKSYIVKWDGTGKKVLIDGSVNNNPGHVLSVQWDSAAHKQYVYAVHPSTSGNHSVYRIQLIGDSVDLANKTLVYNKSKITPFFTVSADGKYAGVTSPWPTIARFNIQTQTVDKVTDGSNMACMPHIAPDNSGWITHMEETHRQIEVISLDNKTRNWINVSQGMPGDRGRYDALNPMWSNHATYLSCMYPLLNCDINVVKGEFCVGKYNGAYSSIEWICITDTTDTKTYREGLGDLWLESGEGPVRSAVSVAANNGSLRLAPGVAVQPYADRLQLDVPTNGAHTVAIVAPSGRLVRSFHGIGPARYSVPAADLTRGVYQVCFRVNNASLTRSVIIK